MAVAEHCVMDIRSLLADTESHFLVYPSGGEVAEARLRVNSCSEVQVISQCVQLLAPHHVQTGTDAFQIEKLTIEHERCIM